MQQCFVYDNSLKFSRSIYGLLSLIAFLTKNHWLILLVGILMILGIISIKLNFFYQLHFLVFKKLLRDKSDSTKRDSGEIMFACGMAGSLLLISFFLLYFDKAVSFAWILVLMVALLMFLAGIAGVCVASLMYAVFKKISKK